MYNIKLRVAPTYTGKQVLLWSTPCVVHRIDASAKKISYLCMLLWKYNVCTRVEWGSIGWVGGSAWRAPSYWRYCSRGGRASSGWGTWKHIIQPSILTRIVKVRIFSIFSHIVEQVSLDYPLQCLSITCLSIRGWEGEKKNFVCLHLSPTSIHNLRNFLRNIP